MTIEPGPTPDATPAWFIAGPDLSTIGERRERSARDQMLATLHQIFPDTSTQDLAEAVQVGGDLTVIVERVLAMQAAAEANAGLGTAGESSSSPCPGPKRRVHFAPSMATSDPAPTAGGLAVEQMTAELPPSEAGSSTDVHGPLLHAGTGTMDRLTDEELNEQMAASGIMPEPTAGSARGAVVDQEWASGLSIGAALQGGTLEELKTQSVRQLAHGALRIDARVIKTANELEEGMLTSKIVTLFVVEVRQLGFRWEIRRRYSEFHRFHELLSLQWAELPQLPPKLILSQEAEDVAERMMQLDAYLRALLLSPALALSPLVCTFLDAIDIQSFRSQMLPRCAHPPML